MEVTHSSCASIIVTGRGPGQAPPSPPSPAPRPPRTSLLQGPSTAGPGRLTSREGRCRWHSGSRNGSGPGLCAVPLWVWDRSVSSGSGDRHMRVCSSACSLTPSATSRPFRHPLGHVPLSSVRSKDSDLLPLPACRAFACNQHLQKGVQLPRAGRPFHAPLSQMVPSLPGRSGPTWPWLLAHSCVHR